MRELIYVANESIYVRNQVASADSRSLHTSLFSRAASDEVLVTSRTFVVIGIGRTEPSVQRRKNATRGERVKSESTREKERALQGTAETHIGERMRGKEKESIE